MPSILEPVSTLYAAGLFDSTLPVSKQTGLLKRIAYKKALICTGVFDVIYACETLSLPPWILCWCSDINLEHNNHVNFLPAKHSQLLNVRNIATLHLVKNLHILIIHYRYTYFVGLVSLRPRYGLWSSQGQ